MSTIRKRVLDPFEKREVLAIISVGCARAAAARYVGCTAATLERTAQEDADFDATLRKVEMQHEVLNLQNIQVAGKKSWRAASWLLERHFPDRYAARKPGTITIEEVLTFLNSLAHLIAEELSASDDRRRVLQGLQHLSAELVKPVPRAAKGKKP